MSAMLPTLPVLRPGSLAHVTEAESDPPTAASIIAAKGVAGWSTGRKFNPAFAGSAFADYAAGALTKLYDQIGARDTTSATGSPAKGTGQINGLDYVKLDNTDDKLAIPSLALGSGDWEMWVAVGIDSTTRLNCGVLGLGRAGGTTGMRGTAITNIDIRSDSAGPIAYNVLWDLVPGVHIIRFKRTGGNLYIDVNGEQVGGSIASPVYGKAISGTFTFDQIGKSSTTVFSKTGLCEIIVFNKILTDAEAEVVRVDMNTAWRSGLYVDKTGGTVGALGWNPETAMQNAAEVVSLIHRRGSHIYFKGGEVQKTPLALNTTNQGGIKIDPIVVDRYGAAGLGKPVFDLGTNVAGSGMANDVGTEYSVTTALTSPQGCWAEAAALPLDLNGKKILRLVPGTAGALTYTAATGTPNAIGYQPAIGQWAYSGGKLAVNVGGDPSLYTFHVAEELGSQTSALRPAKNYITMRNLLARYAPYDGCSFEVTQTGARGYFLTAEYCANDCFGGGGNDIGYEDCFGAYSGVGRTTSGPAGDLYSVHGGADGYRLRCGGVGCDKAGYDDLDTTTMVNTDCWSWGCNQGDLHVLNGGGGKTTYINHKTIRESYDQLVCMNITANANVEIQSMTLYNRDVAGSTVALRCSNGTGVADAKNVVCEGFGTDISIAGGTFTHDHCCLHGTVPYGAGVSAGAGDITSAPLFTDAANLNFIPQSNSPLKGAGVAVAGMTTDFAGTTRPNQPTIGAYEAAA